MPSEGAAPPPHHRAVFQWPLRCRGNAEPAELCRVRVQCGASPAEGGALYGCAGRLSIDRATVGVSVTFGESAAATEVPSRCRAGRVVPSEVHCEAVPGGSVWAERGVERPGRRRASEVHCAAAPGGSPLTVPPPETM